MSELERQLAAARASGDPAAIGESIPFARFMGFSVARDERGLITRLEYDEKLIGNPRLPALHGGSIGAFLEMTAMAHLMWEMEVPGVPKTINITIEYLRSGRPENTFARAVITKHGRRVANVSVSAWQSDYEKPIATAHGHFLLPDVAAS
jgi:acyl-coenzyme A thioesterase PaaI-like protein